MPDCLLCSGRRDVDGALTHDDVPVFLQWPTARLVGPIAYHELEPSDDPRWRESGAASSGEWSPHCCGIACLQMVLAHRQGRAPRMFDLLRDCRRYGCYVRTDQTIKGLIYRPFSTYLEDCHQLRSSVFTEFDRHSLTEHLHQGRMVLLSVHREIRNAAARPPGRGGHIVVVTGYDQVTDVVTFNNPSGHREDNRRGVKLAFEGLDAFSARRGIAVG